MELTVFDADEEVAGYKEESKIDPSVDYIGQVNVIVINSKCELLLVKDKEGKLNSSAASFLRRKEKYSDVAIKLLKEHFKLEEGILSFTGKFREENHFVYFYLFKPDNDMDSKDYFDKEQISKLNEKLNPRFNLFFSKYKDLIK